MIDLRQKTGPKIAAYFTLILMALALSGCPDEGVLNANSNSNSNSNSNPNPNPDTSPESDPPATEGPTLALDQNNARSISKAVLASTEQQRTINPIANLLKNANTGGPSPQQIAGNPDTWVNQTAISDKACSNGGSVGVTGTPSDDFTLTFNNCSNGTETYNGTASITRTVISGDPANAPTADWKQKITYSCDLDVTSSGVSQDGCHDSYTMFSSHDAITKTTSFRFRDATYSVAGASVAWTTTGDGSFYTASTNADGNQEFSLNGTVTYGEAAQTFTVTTVTPFVVDPNTGRLLAGKIVIEGASGSTITLSWSSDGLKIAVDSDGDGTTDSVSIVNYAEFLSASSSTK